MINWLNKKVYLVLENKIWTTIILATITFIFAFIGFLQLSTDLSAMNIFKAFTNAVDIFGLDELDKTNISLEIARLFSYLTIFIGAAFLFVKDIIQKWIVKSIMTQNHSIVCGLGQNNRFYLDSEVILKEPGKIVIVEQDPTNPHIESYKAKGFGVIIGNILDKEFWNNMNIPELQNFIVSTGDDRRNIEVVTEFLDSCEKYTDDNFGINTKIYIHIESRDLNILFQQEVVQVKKELRIEIIPYSFYEDAAKQLLTTHSILGNKSELIHTNEPYDIAIVGSGELAKYIIYQICKIAHLPNQNELTIHCIDKEAEIFVQKLYKAFRYIDKVPNITIKPLTADSKSTEFYELPLWKEKNLTNVIVCQDEEKDNLDTAISLYDKTYLEEANEKTFKTKVLFAIFQEMTLSSKININKEQFREFYTFANANDICSKENLIDPKTDSIAQLVNYSYGDEYNPKEILDYDEKIVIKDRTGKKIEVTKRKAIEAKWFDTARMSDKESSRAQAMHLDIKLLALGLKKVQTTKPINTEELLKKNRIIFEKYLGNQILEGVLKDASKELDKFWANKPYQVKYFPTEYKTLFEKIVHSEHNRWNALHYLNGWVYEEFDGQNYDLKQKMKKIKHHNCLLTLEEFQTPDTQITLIYDVYSLLYIPNYLTNIGFEIVENN
ncbi:hypothetical protein SMGD1_0212 [Sulfurimonas gotlandica GD1]|uniref:RCK N-terminal domain-containing protein n=1 Tax=Sulfurimonas gotlandica (strain DSM 19862 / JCM 16533 / GD1) TaxID=929558 RepID=B6BL07_SULGG|nr:NAD-binding protein [Sulfurimonas gotlandica]EDZ62190.1 TrkA-N domain family [Sulfurimonas gotlandica GD1]EHP28739.1 hypothetical protein SMGD1_0212 [Sulfurimonas gotlandica GD1]